MAIILFYDQLHGFIIEEIWLATAKGVSSPCFWKQKYIIKKERKKRLKKNANIITFKKLREEKIKERKERERKWVERGMEREKEQRKERTIK